MAFRVRDYNKVQPETMSDLPETTQIPQQLSGQRLDVALAEMFPQFSRNRLKQWVQDGQILLDGEVVKPKARVFVGQWLGLNIEPSDENESCEPEDIPLDIVHQDEALIVINKPAGLVVHPAVGHRSGTLQNALLFHDAALSRVPRAGIVHRLDKDTTGLMVVARTLQAHTYLVDQLQQRLITREYQALVHGVLTGGGEINQPIGRHPRDRLRMAVREDGREALTHYRLLQRFRCHSHIQLKLDSGRTHQIRVHMQYLRHPVVGDPVYAGRMRLPPNASAEFTAALQNFKRQALHAWRLSLQHPDTGESLSWEVPIPADMEALRLLMLDDLKQHGDA
jgi:23S rRNA pseudouridine1911/1915/1917 synthase